MGKRFAFSIVFTLPKGAALLEKLKCLTANQIKAVSVTAMLADHLAWWLVPTQSFGGQAVHFIGRLTAPLMCFFIVEGYIHTSNIKRYIGRLSAFTAVSHFPYVIYFGLRWYATTSVMFTLLMGLLAVHFQRKYAGKPILQVSLTMLCCVLAYRSDWSYIAVLWMVCLYHFRGSQKARFAAFMFVGFAFYALPVFISSEFKSFYVFGFLLTVPFILMYGGRRGRKNAFTKWSFYVFYPLHLVILAILRYIIFA